MKKILFSASTASHLTNFHLPYMEDLAKMGHEVHALVNEKADIPYATKVLTAPFTKNLFSWNNIKAIFVCRKLLRSERYDLIITNTTLAAAVVRCSQLFQSMRPQIIHIVHGYLFNKTYRLKKWLYLLPELVVASITDTVLVMNQEDFIIAKKYHLYRKQLVHIMGMGVDLKWFVPATDKEKERLRQEWSISDNQLVLSYVAEMSRRKNHIFILKALAQMHQKTAVLLLAGDGALLEYNKKKAVKYGVGGQVRFLGYRKDIKEIYQVSDIAISSSKIEGLPFNIMEAMGCGLPILASDIKGHQDLVDSKVNGYLYSSNNPRKLADCLDGILKDTSVLPQMAKESLKKIQPYQIRFVQPKLLKIILEHLI